MSEQEMQFASPDWEPGQAGTSSGQLSAPPVSGATVQRVSLPVSPSQPADTLERGYNGYAGVEFQERLEQQQYALPQQKVYQRPRRRRYPWLWIAIVVAAFLFVVGMSQGYISSRDYGHDAFPNMLPPQHHFFKERGDPGTQFNVGANPTINVVDPTGSITVTSGGPAGTVSVQPTSADGAPVNGGPQAQMSQAADGTVMVNVNGSSDDPFAAVNVNITVPSNANLVLQTDSGAINVSNVSGQLTLKSGSGSVNLDGVTLTQNSLLQTDSGDINFFGALDSEGAYQLLSNSGTINVGLQSGASYRLHVVTKGGSYNMNGSVSSPGVDMLTNVGNDANPRAVLTLQTQTGDINVKT